MRSERLRQVAHIYLCSVPPIVFIMAFALVHVSPSIYVPLWIVHSILMIFLLILLGARYVSRTNERSIRIAVAAVLFVLPWIIASVFAGMGPPPFKMVGWADLATEQQVRFAILVVCGVSLAMAFSTVYELAKQDGEAFHSRMAMTCIFIAMPLFIVVMAFWGTVFVDTAITVSKTTLRTVPEWLAPWRHLIDFLSTIEVCLFYTATAMLAMAMKQLKWLSVRSCNSYFAISLLAVGASLLPESVPEPIFILNYVADIPAVTMTMPYLIGLALLRRIDKLT